MDIPDIAGIRTKLQRFLKHFQSCSADERTRDYFRLYTTALISALSRENCEAIALQTGMSVQWFLARQVWDHKQMRNKLQKIIAKQPEGYFCRAVSKLLNRIEILVRYVLSSHLFVQLQN